MTRSFGERRGTRVPSVFQSLQRAARRLTLRRPSTTEPSGKKQPDHAVASRDSVRPRSRLPFKLGLVTMVLSLCSGLATYVILSGLTPIVPTNLVVVVVLLINLVLVLAMLGIIAWQVTGLWLAKRKKVARAHLHTRIVGLFSVMRSCRRFCLPCSPASRSIRTSTAGSRPAPSPSSRTRSTWRLPTSR